MIDFLSKLGIEALNDMQTSADASISKYESTLLLAPTGSGKTLAFLLPILKILQEEKSENQVLILVPTRELSLQIESVWKQLGTGFKINALYGGHTMETEIRSLKEAPRVMVGTPGRIADHFSRNTIRGQNIDTLVFDEFDKSLQMGYQEQMKFILDHIPKIKKRVLVSATQGISIPSFVNIEEINVLNFIEKHKNNDKLEVKLVAFNGGEQKIQTLIHLLGQISQSSTLIFCNQRDAVEAIADELTKKGINCAVFHGKIEQAEREKALIRFRNKSVRYLVTTDLAARGLDIPEMENVVHFQLPDHEQEFIHRNGRTARMNAKGTAYLLHDGNLPIYVSHFKDEFKIKAENVLPTDDEWTTIYVSGGKKDKINKIDIVGFFFQKGKLDKDDLGRIEVQDFMTFVALKTDAIPAFLKNIKDEKMKGKKMKIEVAN